MKKTARMRNALGTAALGAVVASLLAGAAGAQPSAMAAGGAVTQTQIISDEVRFVGPNVVRELTIAGSVSGTLSGTSLDSFTVIIHPNGRFEAHGKTICMCTVNGKQGLLALVLSDTGQFVNGTPVFHGRYVINGGTGELSGLRGVLQLTGTVNLSTGLSMMDYSGEIHSHP
jgi:hypothetical protein